METVASDPVITLTPYAVEMVRKVRAREGLSDQHALRVAVVGGGCSGFSYQLDFDDQPQEGDQVIEYDGVQVRVDPTHVQFSYFGDDLDKNGMGWIQALGSLKIEVKKVERS